MDRPDPQLLLDVPSDVAPGAVVPVALAVTHPGPDALELYLRGRSATFDVEVARASDGTVVWRRLEGAAIQGILQLRVLWPGERFVLHASWDQRGPDGAPVPPGEYRVQAFLLTDQEVPLASAPSLLRIRAG